MLSDELQTCQDAAHFVASAGMARWPELTVDRVALARYLAETPGVPTLSPTLGAERCLAFACAVGVPHAAEIFQKCYVEAIDGGARSVDASHAHVEEVRQHVLELLFVGSPPSGPRIAQYKGQGPLGAWLRTTAKRVALRMSTAEKAERLVSEDALANELADSCDQELALLRTHYSGIFRHALAEALRELPARDRMLLQLSLVGGISTGRIGRMYQLNQSTISRQLQRAACKTLEIVRRRLQADLGIVSEEVESLLAIVRSHIEMTLSCFEDVPESDSSSPPVADG
jgi:RNA polymerase sigma-70 factor, ECF subfamily